MVWAGCAVEVRLLVVVGMGVIYCAGQRRSRQELTLSRTDPLMGRRVLTKVARVINQTVEAFLHEALQMSPAQVAIQIKAEELGYL